MNESILIEQLDAFRMLQTTLVSSWCAVCPEGKDLMTLLDFPKQKSFQSGGRTWTAYRHGAGVRFETDGIVVDVETEVAHPDRFDANRFYDYLRSRGMLELIDLSAEGDRRSLLAEAFESWVRKGVLERHDAELGPVKFSSRTA